MCNGEPLTGANTDDLGREKRIEYPVPDVFRYAAARVLDPDLHNVSDFAGRQGNLALDQRRIGDDLADGMRCIHQYIQDHLIECTRHDGHLRNQRLRVAQQ